MSAFTLLFSEINVWNQPKASRGLSEETIQETWWVGINVNFIEQYDTRQSTAEQIEIAETNMYISIRVIDTDVTIYFINYYDNFSLVHSQCAREGRARGQGES